VALDSYSAARRRHTRVAPADWGTKRIGHMGLFRKEMAAHWPRIGHASAAHRPRIGRMLDELPVTGTQGSTK